MPRALPPPSSAQELRVFVHVFVHPHKGKGQFEEADAVESFGHILPGPAVAPRFVSAERLAVRGPELALGRACSAHRAACRIDGQRLIRTRGSSRAAAGPPTGRAVTCFEQRQPTVAPRSPQCVCHRPALPAGCSSHVVPSKAVGEGQEATVATGVATDCQYALLQPRCFYVLPERFDFERATVSLRVCAMCVC